MTHQHRHNFDVVGEIRHLLTMKGFELAPRPRRRNASKEKGRQSRKEMAPSKKVPTTPQEAVAVALEREYVMMFLFPRRLVPATLQVADQSGGAKTPPPRNDDGTSAKVLNLVKVDLNTIAENCTVASIAILGIPGSTFCRVFMNFKHVNHKPEQKGFIGWDEAYVSFLKKNLFGKVWEKVTIKTGGEKTSIVLKDPIKSTPEKIAEPAMKIVFSAK